jgi:hypothetical protein
MSAVPVRGELTECGVAVMSPGTGWKEDD